MSSYNASRGLRSKNRRIRRKCRRAIVQEARIIGFLYLMVPGIATAARELDRLMSLPTLPFSVLTALREPLPLVDDRPADATARPEIRAAEIEGENAAGPSPGP